MSSIRRGIMLSFGDKYVSQVVAVLTMAVMSRLLTPAEIGLYLVANTLILLADNFRMFGVGIYIVQAAELRRDGIRSAFTVTLLISLLIGAGILVFAGTFARYYDAPEIEQLLAVAALAFCIIPFASPTVAILQRELAFGKLAALNVSAALINSAVTVTLGVTGFGPVSYVWGYVIGGAFLSIASIAIRPDPGIFRPCLREARNILTFGGVSTGVVMINMISDMLPRLAFAKILGFDAAGLYGRALAVCQLPDRAVLSALQPVVLPAMAAHTRAGGELKSVYLKGLSLVSAIQWPVLLVMALLADPVVGILLGAQWDAAVPLLRLMALATMALAPAFMTFPVLVTAGRLRDTLWSSLIALPPSMALMIGAAFFGVTVAAAILLVTAPLQMFVALWFVRRAIGLDWGDLFAAAGASVAIALASATLPAVVIAQSAHGFDLSVGETVVAIAGAAAGWLAGVTFTDHPIRREIGAVWQMAVFVLRVAGRVRRRPAE